MARRSAAPDGHQQERLEAGRVDRVQDGAAHDRAAHVGRQHVEHLGAEVREEGVVGSASPTGGPEPRSASNTMPAAHPPEAETTSGVASTPRAREQLLDLARREGQVVAGDHRRSGRSAPPG